MCSCGGFEFNLWAWLCWKSHLFHENVWNRAVSSWSYFVPNDTFPSWHVILRNSAINFFNYILLLKLKLQILWFTESTLFLLFSFYQKYLIIIRMIQDIVYSISFFCYFHILCNSKKYTSSSQGHLLMFLFLVTSSLLGPFLTLNNCAYIFHNFSSACLYQLLVFIDTCSSHTVEGLYGFPGIVIHFLILLFIFICA